MINSCVLVGRLCAAPEAKPTNSGMMVCNFRLAVNRTRKAEDGQQQADFLDIVCFDKTAQFVAQYVDKGALVGVEGRIQTRSWQTQDGQKRWAVEIIANSVQALETRKDAEARRAQGGTQQEPAPQTQDGSMPRAAGPSSAPATSGDFGPEDDPFGD